MTYGDRTAGSPQLDQERRSKERAALDVAVAALFRISRGQGDTKFETDLALKRIAAILPEAVKPLDEP